MKPPRRTSAAVAVVTALLVAGACSEGQDVTDPTNPMDPDPPVTEPDPLPRAALPEGARDALLSPSSAVDASGAVSLDPFVNQQELTDGEIVVDNARNCVYVPGVVRTLNVTSGESTTEGVGEKDPFTAAVEIMATRTDVLASPLYVMTGMPAHMLFPGGLPVPASSGEDLDYRYPEVTTTSAAPPSVPVVVVDSEMTDTGQEVTFPYYLGHGQFITSIIERELDTATASVKLVGPTGSNTGFLGDDTWGEVLAHEIETSDGPTVINLSFGVYPCTGEDGVALVPVSMLTALHQLVDTEVVLVAASGNAPQQPITLPASLSDADTYDRFARSELVRTYLQTRHDEDPQSDDEILSTLAARIIAVDATPVDFEGQELPYATIGDWVTATREGCQYGTHPGATIRYPDPTNPAETLPARSLPDSSSARPYNVFWCGTSFAAPIVAAEVATSLANGSTVDTVKAKVTRKPVEPSG